MQIAKIEVSILSNQGIDPPKKGKVPLSAPLVPPQWVGVTIHTSGGGVGCAFGDFPQSVELARSCIERELAPLMQGQSIHENERHFLRVTRHFGPLWSGLVARCYSLVDIALWDLKAKSAQLTLSQYLGGVRSGISAMTVPATPLGSSAEAILSQARSSLDQGSLGILVPVGSEEPQFDADQVQHIRDELGANAWLAVDAGERFDLNTALVFSHFLDDVQADWFANPVPPNDPAGLARLAQSTVVPLAVGTNYHSIHSFREALQAGHARVLRPNPYLLGGLTPVIKICQVAELFPVSIVPDCPEPMGVHLGCGLPAVSLIPVWGTALPRLNGGPVWQKGKLTPNAQHGLGITFGND